MSSKDFDVAIVGGGMCGLAWLALIVDVVENSF